MAASTYFDQVQQLYIAYFGRPADTVGLAYWAANVNAANGSVAQVIAGFSASTESGVLYAGATTAQKVSSIYLALFNRNPEAAGLVYWVAQIDSGTMSQAQAAYLIQSSAGPGDATAVANKLAAAKAFTSQIDTAAEISGYVGTTAASYGRAYLNGVDATPASLANATSSTALTSIVATATNTTTTPVTAPDTAQTYTLTAGADKVSGGSTNDTITSTVAGGFGTGDVIDGGAGTDTLTVSGSGSISSSGVTVTNVEAASLTSTSSVNLNTTTWTGLTSLTTQSNAAATTLVAGTGTAVTATVLNRGANSVSVDGGSNVSVIASGSTTGTISVGATTQPTGTVTISNSTSAAGTMGDISVKGGSTVNVTQVAAGNDANTTATQGAVSVTGTTATNTVVVNNTARATASIATAGVATKNVTITDVNTGSATLKGTITSVSVSNASGVSIADTGLTDLNLKGGSGNIILDNSGLTTPINRTLNLTLDSQTGGTLDDADVYTTLNVTTTGNNSTLANITYGALTTLNISGSQTLTLNAATGMSALTTVKVSGSSGLSTTDPTDSKLTSIDASATSGNVTVKIDGTKTSYSGGSGIDKVTISSTSVTQSVTGGAGTQDRLVMDAANVSALITSGTLSNVSGFEQLELSNMSSANIDVGSLGFNYVSVSAFNIATLSNMSSGNMVELNGSGRGLTIGGGFSGANDLLNFVLKSSATSSVSFTQIGLGLSAAGVENIGIIVNDAEANPTGSVNHSLSMSGSSTGNKVFTISGNAGLNLIGTGNSVTSVDASGITLGGFTWTSGALSAAAITVKGSATGTNAIDLSAVSTAVVNYIGGSGVNTITTGGGNDIVTIGNITGTTNLNFGSGTDTLVLAGIATTKTGYAQTSGLGIGDIINFSGAKGGAANSVQTSLGAKMTAQASLDDYLNAATATSVTTGANAVLSWFQIGGNTYIVQDTSANSVFTAGSDTVVQLSGLLELSGSTLAAGVVTMNPV